MFKTWMLATRASMTGWSSVMVMDSGLAPAGRPETTPRRQLFTAPAVRPETMFLRKP